LSGPDQGSDGTSELPADQRQLETNPPLKLYFSHSFVFGISWRLRWNMYS
jgi:hypothetical protein